MENFVLKSIQDILIADRKTEGIFSPFLWWEICLFLLSYKEGGKVGI